jgi:hypothetical protein
LFLFVRAGRGDDEEAIISIRRPLLPVGRNDLDLPTGFRIHPKLPAKSAGKHKCVNRVAFQDTDTQIAVFRDIFERVDRLPHRAFLGLDLKASFDLPQLRPRVFRVPSSPMETGHAPICQARERKKLPSPA